MSEDDPFASLSPRVFGSLPPAVAEESTRLADLVVGDVRLTGTRRPGHACDEDGRVPVGEGYFVEHGQLDACPACFEPERASSHTAPKPRDQVRFARVGIGTGGEPRVLELRSQHDLDLLAALLDAHAVERIIVHTQLALPTDPRIVLAGRTRPARSESGPLRSLELQLLGLAFGPPLDPELVALLEAAKDDRGVIHDAALADRYHEALIEQSRALDELMQRPEPVIESGHPVFPSFPDDDPLPDH